MTLTNEVAKQLINLNPSGFVDQKIADRQFEVIVKSFNALQNGNSIVYIADEVGLGKTYIALGIISLLRHFSENPGNYHDMVIVPKRNLQDKWQKEIKRFVENNYLLPDNRVKSVIGLPIGRSGERELHHRLELISFEYPSYQIYRNSSFSMAVHQEGEAQWKEIFGKFTEHENYSLIKGVKISYARNNGDYLRRLYAYMLNVCSPCIDTVVIDEAHNFKHGIDGEVSQRNQVMSRVMGVIQNDKHDIDIFSDFPGLKEKIKPLAKKIIFLSATPIDTSLIELKNQFDVFLPNHKYKNANIETCIHEIKTDLSKFMIRGVMNIDVNQKPYSRNMYRQEHRKGNVEMIYPNPPPIKLDTAKSVILTGLMQYKIMKELDQKNNKSFEIGLLSGFESFSARPKDISQDAENENAHAKETKDQHLITKLADDYQQHFKTTIPHPKMDVLVDELFKDILKSEKSLVFVRRIASVKELEQKLSMKYSARLIDLIKAKYSNKSNQKIRLILEEYDKKMDVEKIEFVLHMIADKIVPKVRNQEEFDSKFKFLFTCEENEINSKLPRKEQNQRLNERISNLVFNYLLDLNEKFIEEDEKRWIEVKPQLIKFKELVQKNINRSKRLDSDLTELSADLVLKAFSLVDQDNKEEDEDEGYQEDAMQSAKSISSFFFTNFLRTKGKPFKKESYRKPWFELNYLHVLSFVDIYGVQIEKLQNPIEFKEKDSELLKFKRYQDKIKNAIHDHYSPIDLTKIPEYFKVATFLSTLLTEELGTEFGAMIKRLLKNADLIRFMEYMELLEEVLRGVFRNGSGAIPAYLAWATEGNDFTSNLLNILKGEYQGIFKNVLAELKTILNDFEKIVAVNFPESDKVHGLLLNQLPVQGVSGYHKVNISKAATQFRMPGWPYVLIATDILKEGEDLHTYCSKVYHYGIAWNPSDMEQRTGRIDRIGSKCYHQIHNLKTDELPFEKKLQVFFPYIQDSFEVIQVAKVFEGMNRFIETFYDFSKPVSIENIARTSENILNMPEQITKKLESKYDIDHFESPSENNPELTIQPAIGLSQTDLKMRLVELAAAIKNKHADKEQEWVKPDNQNLRITGMIFFEDENGNESKDKRHCPFTIKIIHDRQPGTFSWLIESPIGIRSKVSNSKLDSFKKEFEIDFKMSNESLIAFKETPINGMKNEAVVKVFDHLVFNADKAEQKIFGGDWQEYQQILSEN